jgi:hypothetical protein
MADSLEVTDEVLEFVNGLTKETISEFPGVKNSGNG